MLYVMIIRENKTLWSTIKFWEREGDDDHSAEDERKKLQQKEEEMNIKKKEK